MKSTLANSFCKQALMKIGDSIWPLKIIKCLPMKKNLLIILILSMVLNCTNVSEEDLIDAQPLPEIVTYQANVKAIIDNNCLNCHGIPQTNGATIPLVSYTDVKSAVENNNLIGRISGTSSGSLMPLGGPKLPQNLIDTIIQWEADGLLEE